MWEFIVDNIWSILSLLVAIAGVVFGIVFKRPKVANMLKSFSKVIKSIPEFIRQAEKMTNDPEERKTYVLNQVLIHCQANGFTPTDEQLVDVSEQIDDQVKLSKDINQQSKNNTTKSLFNVGGTNNVN